MAKHILMAAVLVIWQQTADLSLAAQLATTFRAGLPANVWQSLQQTGTVFVQAHGTLPELSNSEPVHHRCPCTHCVTSMSRHEAG